jgi:hypothetical protein
VLEDALDHVRVVVDPQRVGHCQQQRVGGCDRLVCGQLLDEDVGLGGVRAAEDRSRVRVDVADLIAIVRVPAEVGTVPVVDEREDAALD